MIKGCQNHNVLAQSMVVLNKMSMFGNFILWKCCTNSTNCEMVQWLWLV